MNRRLLVKAPCPRIRNGPLKGREQHTAVRNPQTGAWTCYRCGKVGVRELRLDPEGGQSFVMRWKSP